VLLSSISILLPCMNCLCTCLRIMLTRALSTNRTLFFFYTVCIGIGKIMLFCFTWASSLLLVHYCLGLIVILPDHSWPMSSTENLNWRMRVSSRKTTVMSSETDGDASSSEQKGRYCSLSGDGTDSCTDSLLVKIPVCVLCGICFGIGLHKAHGT